MELNIVQADISQRLCFTSPLYQWDYGQILLPTGVELPTAYEVHFAVPNTDTTMTVIGNADGVAIPDELLQSSGQIVAYIYLHSGEDDGETEYKINIPVKARPQPSDYEPTPVEQDIITQTVAALNTAVDYVDTVADNLSTEIVDAVEAELATGQYKGEKGDKGDKGDTGAKGDKGDTPVIPWDKLLVSESASGSVASFSDGADGIPVKSLKVSIEPVQLGSGDPSPTNVRPISGHTSATVTRTADGSSTDYTIDLNGTRYGGTLDVLTGVLTVDRAINVIDGTTNIAYNGILSYGGTQIRVVPSPTKATGIRNLISDKFSNQVPVTNAGYIAGRPTTGYVYFNMPADVTTVQEAKTWFTANPTQVVYELAEPQTIQLTPQEVTSLLGENNISADCGDVEVTYRADTKLYIDEQTKATKNIIAGVETGFNATKNYTVGNLLIVGDNLYRVTANIANGSAIAVNTNVVQTTVAEQLLALA